MSPSFFATVAVASTLMSVKYIGSYSMTVVYVRDLLKESRRRGWHREEKSHKNKSPKQRNAVEKQRGRREGC